LEVLEVLVSLVVVQVYSYYHPRAYGEEFYGATSGELTISLGVPL
jgi:hypothetical protein